MGGTIHVDSVANEGATFFFEISLPVFCEMTPEKPDEPAPKSVRRREVSHEPNPPLQPHSPPSVKFQTLVSPRVLVATDNVIFFVFLHNSNFTIYNFIIFCLFQSTVLSHVRKILHDMDVRNESVSLSGREALRVLRKAQKVNDGFGVVLYDTQNSIANASAISQLIRADPLLSHCRVIALCGNTLANASQSILMTMGIHACLPKPVKFGALKDILYSLTSPVRPSSPMESPLMGRFSHTPQVAQRRFGEASNPELPQIQISRASSSLTNISLGNRRHSFADVSSRKDPAASPFEQLILPVREEDESSPQGSPRARKEIADLKVLLVEDNAVNQRVALLLLKNIGIKADAVVNGREAVEATHAREYDIVLMDCQMPEMDGFEATKAIRERESSTGKRHLVIIAMTANVLEGDREKCIQAGMDDFIGKPIRAAILSDTINKWR